MVLNAYLFSSVLFEGHLDMVRFLLEAGADQEHKTDEMHTALMEACMVNNLCLYCSIFNERNKRDDKIK